MNPKIKLTLIALVCAAIGLGVGLNIPTSKLKTPAVTVSAEDSEIAKNFALKFDDAKVKSVRKTPFDNVYEVILDKNEIVYTNAATDYVMLGNLVSSTDKRNLTYERQDEINTIDFKTLPFAQSFKSVKGTGARQIAIFEDPNCGYCKAFRKTLEGVDNLTIHTFVIDILGADSTAKSKKILCSSNPAQAWDEWMLNNVMPDNKGDCAHDLQKNRAYAMSIGITGTPTIFLENGTRFAGSVDQADLEAALASVKLNP